MGLPPRIPGSRPRHPFGRRAFATGVVVGVLALVISLLLVLFGDADGRGAGIAMLVMVAVCTATVGLLTLAERVVARRRDD